MNFPASTFLTGLSEVKPLLEKGETREIVLTLRVPTNAEYGTRKVVFMEVQPYGNNAAGTSRKVSPVSVTQPLYYLFPHFRSRQAAATP